MTGSKMSSAYCSEWAIIPDAVYAEETIQALSVLSDAQLQQIQDVLNIAERKGVNHGLVAAQALSEDARSIVEDALKGPKWRKRLLHAAIATLVWMYPQAGESVGHDVEHAVSEIVAKMTSPQNPGNSPPAPRSENQGHAK